MVIRNRFQYCRCYKLSTIRASALKPYIVIDCMRAGLGVPPVRNTSNMENIYINLIAVWGLSSLKHLCTDQMCSICGIDVYGSLSTRIILLLATSKGPKSSRKL